MDSTTREPIPFANIQIIGTTRGTSANNRGFFLIPNVPPGQYQIVATAVGYARYEETASLREGVPLVLRFFLAPSAVELDEVLVTGEGQRPIFPSGSSVRRLHQRDMKAMPVSVQGDVVRSLLMLPGIVSTSDVSSRFYVRGGSGDQNLFLLDGMRLYAPFHALGVYSVFDPENIRSAEVYTGAFPAGYGGRLSSVVSLTTKDPRTDRTSARAGMNLLSSRAEAQVPLFSGLQFFASGRHSLFPGTFQKLTGIERTFSFYDFLGKANADVPGLNKLGFLVFLSGDDLRPQSPTEASYQWRNQLVGFTSSGLLAERMYVTASLYVSRYSASRTPQPGSAITPMSTSVHQPGFRVDATGYTSRPTDLYNFGIEFILPEVSYQLVNSSGTRRNYFGFASEVPVWFHYQVEIGGPLLDLGLHADLNYVHHAGWRGVQPRINISQGLGDNWQLRLAYARVSQSLITANNEDDLIPIFDAWIRIPNSLYPEGADHYVAGIEGALTTSTSISLELYRKQFSDLVLYNPEKITARDPDFLAGSGQSWGMETLVRHSRSPFDLSLAYSLSHVDVAVSGYTYTPRYDVRHSVNALAVVKLSRELDFSIRWNFKSGYPFSQIVGFYNRLTLPNPIFDPSETDPGKPYAILGPKNAERLPSYHRLDIGFSYRFSLFSAEGEVDVSVINVYDRKNIFYFERETGRRVNMLPFIPSLTVSMSL